MTALRDIAVRFYKLCIKLYTIRLILLSVDLPLLLQNCEADTLALWQGDEWLLTLSDDKHILQPAVHSVDLDFRLTPILNYRSQQLCHSDQFHRLVQSTW